MGFALNADQKMTVQTAQAMLGEHSDSARVRQAMESDSGIDQQLWELMAQELGWCCLSVPEAYGGVGLGDLDLALLVEQMGYHLACAPFFSTAVLAAKTLELAANDAARNQYLPAIAAGELRATLAWQALDQSQTSMPTLTAKDGGWCLAGELNYVLDGASAELLLVVAKAESGLQLVAVPASSQGVVISALPTMDQTRRFALVRFTDVALQANALITGEAFASGLNQVLSNARLMLAAEQLGVAQRSLDLTVAYTLERVQFGRTIASFQAIKHRCAEMMVHVEGTRSMVYGASLMAPSLTEAALVQEAAAAKAMACETAFFCAQEAIQLHGGVGFTWEYDPHLYFKRAQANSSWLGSADSLWSDIANELLDAKEETSDAP